MVAVEQFIRVKATALFVIPDLFGNLLFWIPNRLKNGEYCKPLVTEYWAVG